MSSQEFGAYMQAAAAELARLYREGDVAGLEALRARHTALGYRPVTTDTRADYVRCNCGLWVAHGTWAQHVVEAPEPKSLHRGAMAERALDYEAPRVVEGELPAVVAVVEPDDDELPEWLFGVAS